jgi:putative flippase GtrA
MMRLLRDATRYAAVSAVSLAVNMAILLFLVHFLHWGNLTAATTSFIAGAFVAYGLSVRYVFSQHRLRDRRAECVTFIAIGAIGLAVNTGVIYLATVFLGLNILIANGVAAGCSFACNFVARRQILFVAAEAHGR